MPLYEYVCDTCGAKRTYRVPIAVRDKITGCLACAAGQLVRQISKVNAHFKGSGWTREKRPDPNTGRYF